VASRFIQGLVNQSIILWVSLIGGLGALTISQADTLTSSPPILSSPDSSHYSHPKESFLTRYESYVYMLTAGVVVFALDRDIQVLSQEHDLHGKPTDQFFRKVEPLGTKAPYLAVAPLLVGGGLISGNTKWVKAGGEVAAGFFIIEGVTQTVKRAFGRERPFQTDSPYQFFQDGNSFFSGHTSSAFTFATVISKSFPQQNLNFIGINREIPLVPVVAYSMAGAVGLQRLYNNVHWASDVYCGALVGYGVGWLVVHFGNKVHLNSMAVIPGEPPMISLGFRY
jgi:hypothetical protein